MDTSNSEVENEEQNDQPKQPKVLTAKVLTPNVRICCIRCSKAIFLTVQSCSELVPPDVEETENKLQYSYSVWFTQRVRGSVSSAPSDYEDNIKLVGSFSSVS